MSEALNEIHAYFGKLNTTTTAPVKQWAYGQKLVIHDADLPNVFEAYYSNSRSRGEASPQIGTDGVVDAPHAFFRSGEDIYVFLMVHEGQDDGRYNKIVHIPIDPCAEPSDVEPEPYEQNVIDQAIAVLNDAVTQCGAYVEHYPTVINGEWYVWDEATEQFVTTGVPATGNGIADARLNNDYTLTLIFTDGSSFTTPISIRGATGDSGVYISDSEPTDPNVNIWIDPSGEDDLQAIVDMVLAEVPTVTVDSALDASSTNPVQNKVIAQKIVTLETVVENVTGTDPVIIAEANHRYVCGELATLDFTPCDSGICDIVFVSGSTATALILPLTVKMPDDFVVETDKTYEINIMDGVYGAVMTWT